MNVDLFTYGAQLVNFALLIFLLQRVLYRPILAAMAARDAEIASRFQSAEEERDRAAHEAQLLAEQRNAIEVQRAALIREARQEAETERKALRLAAHAEVAHLKQAWLASFGEEQRAQKEQLRAQTVDHVFRLAGHLLSALGNINIETAIIKRFLTRIRQLDDEEIQRLTLSLGAERPLVQICSAFAIPAEMRLQLEQALAETLDAVAGSSIRVQYSLDPQLMAGIELRLQDYELTWHLRDELNMVEADLGKHIHGDENASESMQSYG